MTDSNPQIPETPPSNKDFRWTSLDEDELPKAYWEYVAPILQQNGYDPQTDKPTHQWLRENGFRSLLYTLRENHDMTFSTFWEDVLGLETAHTQGYEWGIDHEETITLLEQYLDSITDRGELADRTADTLRYRLGKYVRAYAAANNSEDLITPVERGTDVPEYKAVDACLAAFDLLHNQVGSNRTKSRIHRAVTNWYQHLVRRKRGEINPAENLDEEYNWHPESKDTPALEPDHIQGLISAAATPADRLLIVALGAWGLRSGEVASLHRSQVVTTNSGSVSYIQFESRKNGPGEVSLLYGKEAYERRVAELVSKDEWNGYLFPSSASSTGHITRDTVLNRFDRLASTADLPDEVEGQKPVPQMARRFWYDAYSTTLDSVLEGIDEIATEQGSADPTVVLRNYLSASRNREMRRNQMRERLSEAFSGL